jgi:glutamate/aspartate transport system permease protein
MNYTWDWTILLREPYRDWLLSGLFWTICVALSGWVVALTLGLAAGLARTSGSRTIRAGAFVYISIFRNIPLLLQMFVWFYVVPELLPEDAGLWIKRDLPNPEFWTAVAALAFYTSGRLAEVFRAGVEAVPAGQTLAARALGMAPLQVTAFIVLPQAVRIIVPPLTSEFLSIVKNSSLALTLGVLELTAQSRRIENFTFHGFEAFAAATALYIAIALALDTIAKRMSRHA